MAEPAPRLIPQPRPRPGMAHMLTNDGRGGKNFRPAGRSEHQVVITGSDTGVSGHPLELMS
jgi:hypothetical protein